MLSGWKTGTPWARAISFMPRPVWRVEPRAWPAFAVGLRDQADDGVRAGQQGLERRFGEEAGSHHDDAHGGLRVMGSEPPLRAPSSIFSISSSDGISPRSWARA